MPTIPITHRSWRVGDLSISFNEEGRFTVNGDDVVLFALRVIEGAGIQDIDIDIAEAVALDTRNEIMDHIVRGAAISVTSSEIAGCLVFSYHRKMSEVAAEQRTSAQRNQLATAQQDGADQNTSSTARRTRAPLEQRNLRLQQQLEMQTHRDLAVDEGLRRLEPYLEGLEVRDHLAESQQVAESPHQPREGHQTRAPPRSPEPQHQSRTQLEVLAPSEPETHRQNPRRRGNQRRPQAVLLNDLNIRANIRPTMEEDLTTNAIEANIHHPTSNARLSPSTRSSVPLTIRGNPISSVRTNLTLTVRTNLTLTVRRANHPSFPVSQSFITAWNCISFEQARRFIRKETILIRHYRHQAPQYDDQDNFHTILRR